MKTDTVTNAKHKSIKSKILLSLVLFTLFSLTLLLVCQFFLFDKVYKVVKVSEINTAAKKISASDDDSFYSTVQKIAKEYPVCIRIIDEDGNTLYSSECKTNCTLHLLGASECSIITNEVSNNGRLLMNVKENEYGDSYVCESFSSPFKLGKYSSILSADSYSFKGQQVFVLINNVIEPIDAVKTTYSVILLSISLVLIAASAILAVFLSASIAKPVASVNRAAKELAQAKYTAVKGGYREIDELNETLFEASLSLAEVERMRRELIANISHDLRTPLTMIIGYGEVMRDIPGEMTSENIDTIINESNRLSRLVSDLLDISKIESGAYKLNIQSFSLTDSLADSAKTYSKLLKKDGYKIGFVYNEDVTVSADHTLIMQAVYNLINNAVTFTGNDKLIRIKQTCNTERKTVRVEVSDTGEGISPDQLKHIWDRYYKSSENHKRSSLGSGLGLSIIKNIITLHGGKYGVRTAPGKGSTFYFEIGYEDITPIEYEDITPIE